MPENAKISCQVCGHSNPALTGLGVMLQVREGDFRLLEALLLGALDEVPCEACGSDLGVSPTVLFIGDDPKVVYYTAGTRMLAERAALDQCVAQVVEKLGPGTLLQGQPDHGALRDAIAKHLRAKGGPLKSFLGAKARGSSSEWLNAHFNEIGSSFFALVHIGCTVPQMGIQARRLDGTVPTRDEILESFGEDQSRSLLALLQAWAGNNQKRNLEDDLKRHIVRESLLPGTARYTREVLGELLTSRQWTPMVEYVGYAIVASVCAAADEENPYAGIWTRRFFSVEMANDLAGTAEERAAVSRLLVSAGRAKETIPFHAAWDAVLEYIADPAKDGIANVNPSRPLAPGVAEALDRVCEKAGHADLPGQIAKSFRISGIDENDLGGLLEALDSVATKIKDNWQLNDLLTAIVRPLVQKGNHEAVIQIADRMIARRGENDEARADIETWLGTQLKLMRKPREFLDRIGEKPRDWELQLQPSVRVKLWTERSNALRILGRQKEALTIIESIMKDLPADIGEQNRRVALRNRAILLRETGMLDTAIEQLEELTKGISGEELIETLDSLSLTQTHAGQNEAALANLDRALRVAKGPLAERAPKLRAARALLLEMMDREKESIQELMAVGASEDPLTLIAAASTWANLLGSDYELSSGEQSTLAEVARAIGELIPQVRNSEDFQLYLGCLRLYAGMLERLGEDETAEETYRNIYSECTKLGQPRMFYELVALALRAYEAGENEVGRGYLLGLPTAIAEEVGATKNIWIASQGQTRKLRDRMRELAAVVVKRSDSFDDVRLISELQRDVIGRAQYLRQTGQEAERRTFGVGDEELARLAKGQYPVGVLEWIAPVGLFGCFVSIVSPDGKVNSSYLEQPDVELRELATKIRSRLNNWYVGRKGDPFDFPEWKACEDWLIQQLSSHLAPNGHLVVIEHESHVGIPWHVAGRRWTCSYAASWSSLLTLTKPSKRSIAIGQIRVPKSIEGEEVKAAMKQSALRTREYAASRGIALVEEVDELRADRGRFEEIMQTATVAKLLCHGFIDSEERQIALLLAHKAQLPLLSAASRSSAARAHRFTWENCLALRSAPAAVFSAACSTGVSHIVGMGERLGLFAGLSHTGTRAFAAPKWDMIAESGLPVLDDALEGYLSGEPIALAVHRACTRAESASPLWQAWNLMVEGDWDEHI